MVKVAEVMGSANDVVQLKGVLTLPRRCLPKLFCTRARAGDFTTTGNGIARTAGVLR
jgi:hypothetical protein